MEEQRNLGWRCEGIDMEPSVRDRLAAKNITVHIGDALDILRSRPADYYDAVLSCHSLEHFVSPCDVVQEVTRVLRRGGQFVVTVPNYQSWLAWRYPDKWFALECPAHLHIFGIQSLTHLLVSCGLRVKKVFCSEISANYRTVCCEKDVMRYSASFMAIFSEVRARLANVLRKGDVVTIHARKE